MTRELAQLNIAFSGAAGTGKTTLLQELVANYTDLPFVHSPLWSAVREFYKYNGVESERELLEYSVRDIRDIQFGLLEFVANRERIHQNGFMSERSVFDYYLYTLLKCGYILTTAELEHIENLTVECMQRYNIVFYCKHVYDIRDTYRTQNSLQNWMFKRLYALRLHALKKRANIALNGTHYHTMKYLTLDNRVREVQNVVNAYVGETQ